MDRGRSPQDAVVDTNVVALYLLRTEPPPRDLGEFWETVGTVWAPSLWEAEIVNVAWRALRTGVLAAEESLRRLETAAALGIRSVPVRGLWEGALTLALAHDHAPYDTLFVELARRLGVPLATYDGVLLRKFPRIARRPGELRRRS
jgi:predicted nucleic acid-binding protein